MNLRHTLVGGLSIVLIGAGLGAATAGANAPETRGEFIVVLKPGGSRAGALAAARAGGGELLFQYRHALDGFAVSLPAAAVSGIERNPNVLFVAESRELHATAPAPPPSENPQVLQRSVDRIDAELSSARSGDGRGAVAVNVAVLDSGIDSDHPDLNVVGGVNCVNDSGGFEDTYGHGTLVAGSIAARDNEIGFVGVAPGAALYAIRVIKKNGFGTDAMILCGIDWVTSTRADADPTNDIAVANMSLGGKDPVAGSCGNEGKNAFYLAVCRSIAAGVTYVTSAGNEGDDIARYEPAGYDEVLTVTAMNDTDGAPGGLGGPEARCGLGYADDTAADFSNFATSAADLAHTVAAPGVCVPSTYLDGLYGRGTGTSFAAPLVAGTVALCIASGPCAGLTPAQIVQTIVADAAASNAGSKNAGYGFSGDPLRPLPGRAYGYLLRAGGY
jgi:subtilisin family serine protease